ncbi:acyl-CoA dehydrogenase-like protein [Fusarium oxysporum Fo47]|uniref:acyl-CoA dehydrogenase-like protein n=1 Tax=Fusarium oxysporum Fo47 TaxID=660027 RepID=UPI002869C700|nr:acyl-CoA dehydrogenase-like protein [Fusarium oxysporum Fo47]QKD60136.2 acyl-CoA dehydrogenase-like protein [Fusarium oxysporum Fo47]
MLSTTGITREEVSHHIKPDDLWYIVDHEVYDLTGFAEAHPGGNVVLEQALLISNTRSFEPKPGDLNPVPYAESPWLRPEFSSPDYTESHHRLQQATRKFRNDAYIRQKLVERMAKDSIHAMRLGLGEHLHERTLLDGMLGGLVIGLTAVVRRLPHGDLRTNLCLAISETFAGSDGTGILTTAAKTPDGKHYVVSGVKKWITNGFSVLLIPRSEGVTTKTIKTSYSATAGTAYVQFDKVMVPVDHLFGEEHQGFTVIMSTFINERFAMICGSIRGTRGIVEGCLKWCDQRIVFKRRLVDQPASQSKLAKMIASVEPAQAWLEQITEQMLKMSYIEQATHLGGHLALLKPFTNRVAHERFDTTGMGRCVEKFQRTFKSDAILGGAEEILSDLAVRQAMKKFPRACCKYIVRVAYSLPLDARLNLGPTFASSLKDWPQALTTLLFYG